MASATQAATLFARLAAGEIVDAGGATVRANELAECIQAVARAHDGPRRVMLSNAVIDGHLILDLIENDGRPISFSFIGGAIRGVFRARLSTWDRLVVADAKLGAIDLPRARVTGDLLLEKLTVSGWLEARGCEVAGTLALNGSEFGKANSDVAVQLDDARIGLALRAADLKTAGTFSAIGIRIGGDLRLDGAHLSAEPGAPSLNLTTAKIEGSVSMGPSGTRHFKANGAMVLARAEVGDLSIVGASLDGGGRPALIADQMRASHGINIGGVPGSARQLKSKGQLRLLAVRTSGQVQIYNAGLTAEEGQAAVTLDSSAIDADVVIGGEAGAIECDGDLSITGATIAGRLWVTDCKLHGRRAALWLRDSAVGGVATLRDLACKGSLQLEGMKADGLIVEDVSLERIRPPVDKSNQLENYAHEDDALFDAHFCAIRKDIYISNVRLFGGDLRLVGADIGGTLRMTTTNIKDCGGQALLAQSLRVRMGIMCSGAPGRPCQFQGDVILMGSEIQGGITLLQFEVGQAEAPCNLILADSVVGGSIIVADATVFGTINADAVRVSGDFRLEDVHCQNRDDYILVARAAEVGGRLFIGNVRSDDGKSRQLDGYVQLDACKFGTLTWDDLLLGAGASFAITNTEVVGALRAKVLRAAGKGQIDLSGSKTALLVDGIGNGEDSWGAGLLNLSIGTFHYARVQHPSGTTSDDPYWVRYWRTKWLRRQGDTSSTQAARHLATTLRTQGQTEAARLVMMDAFAADGNTRLRPIERIIAKLFGLAFGHGFGGSRALITVLVLWLAGTFGTIWLNEHGLLVRSEQLSGSAGSLSRACGDSIDPMLYAADVMLPVLDLGQERRCEIGAADGATLTPYRSRARLIDADLTLYGDVHLARFLGAAYAALGWITLSLAIATWAGVFRRSGRD